MLLKSLKSLDNENNGLMIKFYIKLSLLYWLFYIDFMIYN